MKKTGLSPAAAMVLFVLCAAMLLSASACGKSAAPAVTAPPRPAEGETLVLGEGAKEFDFEITFSDGSTGKYKIKTDAETVGEALQALGLIDGDEGPYGLYVKTAGGETVEYENGGRFWSFSINGEYANTGVDMTEIEPGASYAFSVATS